MYLQTIFDNLTAGELSTTALGGSRSESGEISPVDYPKIIPSINMAIMEIHKRFPIRMEAVTVLLHDYITMYRLDSAHAFTNPNTSVVKYLMDSCDFPFVDKILRVEEVKDMYGNQLPINDKNNRLSVFTPRHNVVQHTCPKNDTVIEVVYRSSICDIPKDLKTDPACLKLDLPAWCLAPLLTYVRGRLELGMIRGENAQAEAQLTAKFNMECDQIEMDNLLPTDAYTNTDIHAEGWR